MDFFSYHQGELFCEDVSVAGIAQEVGTPVYIYSMKTILMHLERLRSAFREVSPLICYSVKANASGRILSRLAASGCGFDVVSGGELYRVLRARGTPDKIVFSGVGKSDDEIAYALAQGILLFNVESRGELDNINAIAQEKGQVAPVAVRVNPDVDSATHTYITTGRKENKFGLDLEKAEQVAEYSKSLSHVKMRGVHMHIGSQITDVWPYVQALSKVLEFARRIRRNSQDVEYLDAGGGFGIHYRGEEARAASEFAQAMVPLVKKSDLRLILEPGRFLVGNAGILLTKVLYVKENGKRFAICDSGMNHLIRPALYGAYHRVWPALSALEEPGEGETREGLLVYDVVGPVCESADFFAKDRPLPPLKRGDLLAVFSAGAYGMVMSSNYNSFPRPAEVLVEGREWQVARKRETYEDIVRGES